MNQTPPNLPSLAAYPASMFAVWTRAHADPASRQRRTLGLGIGLSALTHVLLLALTFHYRTETPLDSGGQPEPLTVRLAQLPRTSPPPPPLPSARPKPRPERQRPKVIAIPKPEAASPPPQATPAPAAPPEIAPAIDMSAMINAARERRRREEEAISRENAEAAAAGRGPTAGEIAMANIQRNLHSKRDGTGGIFQVTHKGVRTATFVFRGWTPGARNSSHQSFEVDAGPGGNVELAIVRRMIQLIRTHYTGDFNWESHRLGRVIVKSARPEDNAELEAFLMREFFGD
ncbi:MAG TPA: hypothetical protein VEC06_15755 [Paucimonas sp.]|nr:hypothetical protein [Paucimonas sp.]